MLVVEEVIDDKKEEKKKSSDASNLNHATLNANNEILHSSTKISPENI